MEILLAAVVSAAVAATVVLVALRRHPSMGVSPLATHAEATAVPSTAGEAVTRPARRGAPSRPAPSARTRRISHSPPNKPASPSAKSTPT